jgi:hypothetical protein
MVALGIFWPVEIGCENLQAAGVKRAGPWNTRPFCLFASNRRFLFTHPQQWCSDFDYHNQLHHALNGKDS